MGSRLGSLGKRTNTTRLQKTYTVHFPRLAHNKFWRSANWSNKVNWFFMVPGAQGYSQTSHTKTGHGMKHINATEFLEEESFTTPGLTPADSEDHNKFYQKNQTMQQKIAWPCICLSQPYIPDETGYMKFRYSVKYTTQLHIRRHLIGDLNAYTNSKGVPSTFNMLEGANAFSLPHVLNVEKNGQKGDLGYYMMPYTYPTKH